MCNGNSKASKYRKDHNYLPELKKFTKKDLLVLSLYNEWVRIRYTKPTTYLTLVMASLMMVIASFSILYTMQDATPIIKNIIGVASFLLILLTCNMLWQQSKNESSEVEKLNAMRDAIEDLSK